METHKFNKNGPCRHHAPCGQCGPMCPQPIYHKICHNTHLLFPSARTCNANAPSRHSLHAHYPRLIVLAPIKRFLNLGPRRFAACLAIAPAQRAAKVRAGSIAQYITPTSSREQSQTNDYLFFFQANELATLKLQAVIVYMHTTLD